MMAYDVCCLQVLSYWQWQRTCPTYRAALTDWLQTHVAVVDPSGRHYTRTVLHHTVLLRLSPCLESARQGIANTPDGFQLLSTGLSRCCNPQQRCNWASANGCQEQCMESELCA